jgi:nitroreductase
MDVTEAIETRLEVREYADERVDAGTKRQILNAGRLAPSGKNLQHWDFVLADDGAGIDRLADHSPTGGWVRGADFAVVVLTDPSYPYHEIDAGRAVTHMQLAGWSRGVGSCVYTGVEDEWDLLGHPAALTATLVAAFGHPTRPLESFVGDKDRVPLDEVVHHGTYGGELTL